MEQTEHKSFFRTHKVLAFLPLLLMGAVVFLYVQKRMVPQEKSSAGGAPGAGLDQFSARASSAAQAGLPASPPPLPEVYDPSLSLDIQGSPEFKTQVTHALKLIWMSDRDTFLSIKKNLSVIRNEDKTGFYFDGAGRPVAAISNDHAFRSLTWCAGVIAHQASHASDKMASRRKPRRSAPPLPGERAAERPAASPLQLDYKGMDAILEAEDRAFTFQLEVLRAVGAPKAEVNLVLKRAPRDFSAGHDGSYTLNP
jgi:hypothetical protein